MEFNLKLIELRKARGWSQEQLGDKINVTRQTISKWELGETTPELKKLKDLSALFGLSIDELIGNESVHTDHVRYAALMRTYRYTSRRTLFNLPLVDINIGRRKAHARGIIAVGTTATGLIAIGLFAKGVIAMGLLSLGVISLGVFALGLLLSVGTIAIGTVAVGAIALGWLAIGGLSIGVYAIGGCSVAQHIAAGGYAQGIVAIGDTVSGEILFDDNHAIYAQEVKSAIAARLPNTPHWIADMFANLGEHAKFGSSK